MRRKQKEAKLNPMKKEKLMKHQTMKKGETDSKNGTRREEENQNMKVN